MSNSDFEFTIRATNITPKVVKAAHFGAGMVVGALVIVLVMCKAKR